MQRNDLPTAAEYSPVSRRQALAGVGTLAAGGVGLAATLPDGARASVTVAEFFVADAEFEAETVDPVVDATVEYDYDAANSPVDALAFALVIDGTVVASDDLQTSRSTLSGETDLSGRVVDSDAWSASDFEPAVGESVSQTLSVTVTFDVVESDGSSIVSDEAGDSGAVVVSHPQDSAYVATVGGDAVIIDGDDTDA